LARAETSPNRVLYVSPLLSEDVHLSGVPKITVKVASSKPAANLSVWLVSLPWNAKSNAKITDNIITRGWADPQNHSSLTKGEPLVTGKFYDVSFELMPDDQIIKKGQQIGLLIFSSDNEYTLHPAPGTELTLDLDGTTLMLPIVGGVDALNNALQEN
jgi:X-Pro dipeptidyl-peptidase